MRRTAVTRIVLGWVSAAAISLAACHVGQIDDAPTTTDDGARLTIVGDASLSVSVDEARTLVVRYHDRNGRPLAGRVSFVATGGELVSASGVTDANGEVSVALRSGYVEGPFTVTASAAEATPVQWQIRVGPRFADEALIGVYDMGSDFPVRENLQLILGQSGTVLREMCDDVHDPATWMLDMLVQEIDSDVTRGLITVMRPGLDADLNYYVGAGLCEAIDAFLDSIDVPIDSIHIDSLFEVYGDPIEQEALRARHSVEEISIAIPGDTLRFSLEELLLGQIVADEIPVDIALDRVVVGEHNLRVTLGQALLALLDTVFLPAYAGGVDSIGDLLVANTDCWLVADTLDWLLGTEGLLIGLFEAQCRAGMQELGGLAEELILSIDLEAAGFVLEGSAGLRDHNADGRIDELTGGRWQGTLKLGFGERELTPPSHTFRATRIAQ